MAGNRKAKPEEFVRVYDILLQVCKKVKSVNTSRLIFTYMYMYIYLIYRTILLTILTTVCLVLYNNRAAFRMLRKVGGQMYISGTEGGRTH